MMDSIYDIRFARLDEADDIIDFYRKYWNENHALVKSKALFDFQHKYKDRYNIIIAYNKETKEIDGTWGLIPVSQYDYSLEINGDYWGGILKIRDDVKNREIHRIAFRMYKYVLSLPNIKSYISSGLGDMGQRFMNPFNKNIGILNQYYIANRCREFFNICKNPTLRNYSSSTADIKFISDISNVEFPTTCYKPIKSKDYIINRFLHHPYYKYDLFGVFVAGVLKTVFVTRKITIPEKGNIIRIVDCLGTLNGLGCLGNQFQQILLKEDAEYIDILNHGIESKVFIDLGFEPLDLTQSNTIIPGYFEPFEMSNVSIHYAYNMTETYCIFKADSDQDRPNII